MKLKMKITPIKCFIPLLKRYESLIPEDIIKTIKNKQNANTMLHSLTIELQNHNPKIYIIIDEYDNFTNTILANYGSSSYMKIAKEDGYFKQFFTALKALTSGTQVPLQRLFITGVSPITLDDVTSGFNIGENISSENTFNNILGFTQKDVENIVDYYIKNNELTLEKNTTLALLKEWYGGYMFSEEAQELIYNTDGVLYFIKKAIRSKDIPEHLIDENLRMDYTKLQQLIFIDSKLNGNFKNLSHIIANNTISFNLAKTFPQEKIADEENFLSLLHYFGLISFTGKNNETEPVFSIPNNTILSMIFNYMKAAIDHTGEYHINIMQLRKLVKDMAFRGEYQEMLTTIAEIMQKNTSVRDLIGAERSIQIFFLAYFIISDIFIVKSEAPYGTGYADIALIPFLGKYPDIEYAFLIEFKYIKTNISKKDYLKLEKEAIRNATKQLENYSQSLQLQKELTKTPHTHAKIKKIIAIFQGSELKYHAEL